MRSLSIVKSIGITLFFAICFCYYYEGSDLHNLQAQSSTTASESSHTVQTQETTKLDANYAPLEITQIVQTVDSLISKLIEINKRLVACIQIRDSVLVQDSMWSRYTTYIDRNLDTLYRDCSHQDVLDSLEIDADAYDALYQSVINKLNWDILSKHEGHTIWRSEDPYPDICLPAQSCAISYECKVCGHFDLYEYCLLRRILIDCDSCSYWIPLK